MLPPKRDKIEYERVKDLEWVPGIIEDVGYDMEHKSRWEGKDKVGPAVRFKFKLDGYQYPHYSRWMSFNTGEKANLYKKYLSELVEHATPDMEYDLDHLKNFPVKTMWKTKDEYQNLEMIAPLKGKAPYAASPVESDEEIPF